MHHTEDNIVSRLMTLALSDPYKTAFIISGNENPPKSSISYRELALRVRKLACHLIQQSFTNKNVLLVYQDADEFIIAFLACQYAGAIPVPVPYAKGSRQQIRLQHIIEDACATAMLCNSHSVTTLQPVAIAAGNIVIMATDDQLLPDNQAHSPVYHETAFIQYTSGSTGKPKGVVVSHRNLMHNQQLLQQTFGCDEKAVIFSWLPFHHDMGLIGNILHTIYAGCTGVLMSPFHFMQTPLRWLQAISEYQVTHSGGPNFAYDLCVDKIAETEVARLDLSSWKVAYNGSEPIQHHTIQRFSQYFKPAGFSAEKFYPCYGLAEATLLVSGAKAQHPPLTLYINKTDTLHSGKITLTHSTAANAQAVVGSGAIAAGMDVKIIGPPATACAELEAGEICISGDSVTSGYWNKDNSELFYETDGRRFLKTGDSGFLYQNQLFVHGRIKEMLIVRGKNIYPYDIEQAVSASHPAIETNGVAAFRAGGALESVVIVAEVKRIALKELDAPALLNIIDQTVSGEFGIIPYDIVLTGPLGIPRTTSGKLQRIKCSAEYGHHILKVIASKNAAVKPVTTTGRNDFLRVAAVQEQSYTAVKAYLADLILAGNGQLPDAAGSDQLALTEIGLDSLRSVELINIVNKELGIYIDPVKVFQDNTLQGLINVIEQMLWLNNKQTFGEEIKI
jgi:acyl-CoA synthetase (AMP-forming)/AMP-acid ligase II/acyl carrier protein